MAQATREQILAEIQKRGLDPNAQAGPTGTQRFGQGVADVGASVASLIGGQTVKAPDVGGRVDKTKLAKPKTQVELLLERAKVAEAAKELQMESLWEDVVGQPATSQPAQQAIARPQQTVAQTAQPTQPTQQVSPQQIEPAVDDQDEPVEEDDIIGSLLGDSADFEIPEVTELDFDFDAGQRRLDDLTKSLESFRIETRFGEPTEASKAQYENLLKDYSTQSQKHKELAVVRDKLTQKMADDRRTAGGQLAQTYNTHRRMVMKSRELFKARFGFDLPLRIGPIRTEGLATKYYGWSGENEFVASFEGDLVETAVSLAKMASPSSRPGPRLIAVFSKALPKTWANLAESREQVITSLSNALIKEASRRPKDFPGNEVLMAERFRTLMGSTVDKLIEQQKSIEASDIEGSTNIQIGPPSGNGEGGSDLISKYGLERE